MKHLFCISLLFLSAGSIHAQKQPAQNIREGKVATCNHPKFKNKEIIGICQQGHSCKKWVFNNKKQNGVKFNVGTNCPGLYNFALGPCRYIVYKQTGTSGTYEIYQKVEDFTCNKNSGVIISNAYFTNNTQFIIILYETPPGMVYNNIYWSPSGGGSICSNTSGTPINSTGVSDSWRFTTLSLQGGNCGSGGSN